MKSKVVPTAVAAATLILLPLSLAAAPGSKSKAPPPSQAERLARFDANGDGELDKAERRQARETLKAERPGRGPAKAGAEMRDRMRDRRKHFDQDGDGQLDAAEQAAFEAANRAELEKRPGAMARRAGPRRPDAPAVQP